MREVRRIVEGGGLMSVTLSIEELRRLGREVLVRAGAPEDVAARVTEALVRAECDGLPTHGFSRLPFYAEHVRHGRVRVDAPPLVTRPRPAVVLVDARDGFAFPAIEDGLAAAIPVAREQGCAMLGITRSHHCGVAGHHVENAAEQGLVAFMCSNTAANIAPWGGRVPSFGTNPLAFACPRQGRPPLVIDLSLSTVTRGRVMAAAKRGETIPEGWVLDAEGRPATDPGSGLKGTLTPLGGAKGAALALMVEILAAALTGSRLSFETSSMFQAEGDPLGLGQFFFLIDPSALTPGFSERVETLFSHMLAQPGVRLPGDRRHAARERALREGVTLSDAAFAAPFGGV
ncbi:Ldh family oxidoreductase [Desulfovibrio aminophilus]|uniref:Ldh family oxidoreductase n=1 Tax=Desulfovibrio aminophilus TaxID=81425 RepID=UPI003394CABC